MSVTFATWKALATGAPALTAALLAAVGCRRAPVDEARARADAPPVMEASATAETAETQPTGASGASFGASSARGPAWAHAASASSSVLASVRLAAVSPRTMTEELSRAPLADASIALRGTRADGTGLISFRRGRAFYELSSVRAEGEIVWLRAIDPEAADDAPPLAWIGVSTDALDATDATRAARVAIDRRALKRGRACVVARVVDRSGAARAGVLVAASPSGDGVRVDDAQGELVRGDRTGPRGLVLIEDVDPASGGVDLSLTAPRTSAGARLVHARVEAGVPTDLLVELD
jgi:hypothetical protein